MAEFATKAEQTGVTPPSKKRGRGCLVTCLLALALGVVLLCVVGAGGYYLYTTGAINQRQILNAIGQGAGEINILNASDDSLDANLSRLDTESGEPESVGSFTIEPTEIDGFTMIEPGRYQLEIVFASGSPGGGTCTMKIVSGDYYQLVAVTGGVAIASQRQRAETGADLNMATSSLCQK